MVSKGEIRFLLEISKKGRGRLWLAALLVLLSSICYLGPFYTAYLILERIISSSVVLEELFILGNIALACLVCQMFFLGIAMNQSHIAAYNILFSLRVGIAEKMMKLPLGFYSKNSSGMLKKIIMGDVEAIEEFVAHNLVDLLSVVILPVAIFVWLSTFNIPLAVISILPVILGSLLQRLRMRLEGQRIHKFFMLKGEMNRTIIDFIRGMPVIKAFNQSVFSFRRYKDEAEKYSRYWIDLNKGASPFFAIYSLLMDCGVIFILPVGAFMYLNDTISLSTFMMFMFIGLGLTRFMKQLTNFGSNITQILKGVEQIRGLLDEPEIPDQGSAAPLENFDLEFDAVGFGYEEQSVLRDVSFAVPQGSMTALVGSSGAGKTTVGRLIPRFWDVDEGSIRIGGVDVRDLKYDYLMKKVSFVFQDVFMFNDSILENIRMGDVSKTRDEVVRAAERAQAHSFIEGMEDGYDTLIGAGGTYLSGGEKQRIAIARALLKDSPIVILDEATSYADTENEAKIQEALNALLQDKTVIIIAHRLSTIRHADQILVFNEGRITERGRHEELLALAGEYRNMWDMHMDASDWGIGSATDETLKQEAVLC